MTQAIALAAEPLEDRLLEAARFAAGRQPPAGAAEEWKGHLRRLAGLDDIGRVILGECGVDDPPPVGSWFDSPLPLEGNAEACLWRGDQGHVLLLDERLSDPELGTPPTITLSDAYASCTRRKLLRFKGACAAV